MHVECLYSDLNAVLQLEFLLSNMSASSWQCPLCHVFASKNLKGVVRHIGAVHSHEAGFHVTCGIDGCPRTYGNFHSYKKHMFLKHREEMEVGTSTREVVDQSIEEDGCNDSDFTSAPSNFFLVRFLEIAR